MEMGRRGREREEFCVVVIFSCGKPCPSASLDPPLLDSGTLGAYTDCMDG